MRKLPSYTELQASPYWVDARYMLDGLRQRYPIYYHETDTEGMQAYVASLIQLISARERKIARKEARVIRNGKQSHG